MTTITLPSTFHAGRFHTPEARLLHALGLLLAMMAIKVGIGIAAAPLLGPDFNPFDGSPAAFAVEASRAVLGLAIGWFGLLHLGQISLRDLGWRDLSTAQVGLGLAAFIPCVLSVLAVLASMGIPPADLFATIASQPWPVRLLCLFIGIIAGFFEETFFRGYLQPALSARLGRAGGIAATAVIFSLIHLPRALPMFVGRLLLGLVFGVLRDRDRPLWAPAIAHALVWVIIGAV